MNIKFLITNYLMLACFSKAWAVGVSQPASSLEEVEKDFAKLHEGSEGEEEHSPATAVPEQQTVRQRKPSSKTHLRPLPDGKHATPKVIETVPEENTKTISRELTRGIRVEDIIEPPSNYHYASFGRGDPFIPPLIAVKTPSVVPGPEEVPLVSPLQKYALQSLKIAGVWRTDPDGWKAMVLTSDGVGIITKKGDFIGNKGGRVEAVDSLGLVVREYTVNKDGTRQFSDSRISLESSYENTGLVAQVVPTPTASPAAEAGTATSPPKPPAASAPVLNVPENGVKP